MGVESKQVTEAAAARKIICIPARYASVRFPGKVLANIGGKPMLRWVYERASEAKAGEVIIAADDSRVAEAAALFGAKVVMTRPEHPSGTDRIWEAVRGIDFDIVVNVQGDEPFIDPKAVDALSSMLEADPSIDIGTVVVRESRSRIGSNPNMVKAVLGADGRALYFSRSPVPFHREGGEDCGILLHWGVYAYRKDALRRFVSLPEGRLERCEKLEQLRALENGMSIKALIVDAKGGPGVDTPDDLVEAERFLASGKPR